MYPPPVKRGNASVAPRFYLKKVLQGKGLLLLFSHIRCHIFDDSHEESTIDRLQSASQNYPR